MTAQRIARRVIRLQGIGGADAIRDLSRLAITGLYRALGAGVAIGIMESLARLGQHEAIRVPFVTSIVLTLFGPASAPAQPYAIVTGHLVSSVAGLGALICLGPGDASAALGVGAAALLMAASRAMHPPAGIDAFLIAYLGLPWSWIVNPVLIGAVLLAAFSRLWASGGRYLSPKGCR